MKRVGIVLITGDRGLAGAFNTNIIRDGMRLGDELREEGAEPAFSVVGRKGVSALTFRKQELTQLLHRLHRPARLRQRARDRRGADRPLRRRGARPGRAVYNRYVSPLTQHVWRQTLLPLQQAEVIGEGVEPRRSRRRGDRDREGPQPARSGSTSPRPRSCSRS